jgi:4-hydroxybenzoate polyprenyltransferase
MIYLKIALLSLLAVIAIIGIDYYYDVPSDGIRNFEMPLLAGAIYFALFYILSLGCFFIIKLGVTLLKRKH